METEDEILENYRKIKRYINKFGDPKLDVLVTNFEKKLVPYLAQNGGIKMEIKAQDLIRDVASKVRLHPNLARAAVKGIMLGVDYGVTEGNITAPTKTLEGMTMTSLPIKSLVAIVAASSGLDHKKAEDVVHAVEQSIIEPFKQGYEVVEIENLGTYRKPPGIKVVDISIPLVFEPVSIDIP